MLLLIELSRLKRKAIFLLFFGYPVLDLANLGVTITDCQRGQRARSAGCSRGRRLLSRSTSLFLPVCDSADILWLPVRGGRARRPWLQARPAPFTLWLSFGFTSPSCL